ncbi:RimL Acetyltransferases, including N-acetylases of ribosomal proteins [uncultured Caudovirales phage]|uniref:RimL Acetyltransferases, including N-acetylases of ribosomal proteins n=1 Tax=uncultured Caudovirales phage TaxID=2100421 RepID=A0A6J5NI13_9CAUD|nr:RimL Acetyltransferases, including N-acetylases of ribosomal proteins [uncultured Caudovirales phage]
MPAAPSSKTRWIYEHHGVAAAYIAKRTNTVFSLDHHGWLCLDADDRLVGAVLLHDFDGHQVMFSIALTPKARILPSDLRRLCEAAFNQLDATRIEMRNSPTNDPAIKMARVFGMTLEGTRRYARPNGDDEHIWGLLKEDCRWLRRPQTTEQ